MPQILPSTSAPDADAVARMLALNAAHEVETSPLDEAALRALIADAFGWAAVGGGRDALLIAFDQDADCAGTNFAWFKARHARFVYVDRVIVAAHARGASLARRLYDALIATMHEQGHGLLTCEINLDPPNPASLAMHAAMGFAEVGQALLPNGKTVSYQVLELDRRARRDGRP